MSTKINVESPKTYPGITLTKTQTKSNATLTTTPKVDKSKAKQTAKENLEARVTELLDLKDNFLQATVINNNGKFYLKLSRQANDKLRPKERHEFSMSAIKSKLGVKNGVLKDNNDLKDITGRDLYEESGSATLEQGKSLLIPLNELGQNFSWYQFGRKDLIEFVNAYLNCK